MSTFKINWIDFHREPKCAPDPRYPNGKDIVVGSSKDKACYTELPYPAERCGMFHVECGKCGISVGVTTAGRPDDPRSVRVPCKINNRRGLN